MEPRWFEVVDAGMHTTVQDLGRPGHAGVGVGPSGAADRAALRLANRLVGNAEQAPAFEVAGGGLVVRAGAACVVAVTGAPRTVHLDGRAVAMHAPLHVPAGALVAIGVGGTGLYTYLAVDGALAVAPVLGSASTDVLGGIGPPPPAAGDRVPVGPPVEARVVVDVAPVAPWPLTVVLRVRVGPRADRLAPGGLDQLCAHEWVVGAASNRVAQRLVGPPLAHLATDELPSEGLVRGAVQVPPDGCPVVFGPDHPTTGGYPVLAVVIDDDLDAIAQAAPGTPVRFVRRP